MAEETTAKEKYIAEFIGTFVLVFTVGCNVLSGSPVWAVTSIALSLMVGIYALGSVSGANFNPAVSLSLALAGKLEFKELGPYMGVQLAAGLCAGLSYGALFGKVFELQPAAGFSWWRAGLAELIYTWMLCFVVLNVACSKMHAGKNQFYGLAIGFVVIAGGYGAGHISGGCFNPAVAFGIDLASLGQGVPLMKSMGWSALYIPCEFVGAMLATVAFSACRPEETNARAPAPDACDYPLSSRFLSEFLGTYMLVLTVGLNVLGGSPAPVWSIAASLMCMIYALGSCSGAHFNPAVTIAIAAAGRDKIAKEDIMPYIVAQLLGGTAAAFTYQAMENGKVFPLAPNAAHNPAAAWVFEFFFTFLLAFVVLSVATTKEGLSEYFGLAIGSCVTAGGCAIGAVSGGSLNPAVTTGIAITGLFGGHGIFHFFIYVIFEIAGGLAAAGLFQVVRPSEYKLEKLEN